MRSAKTGATLLLALATSTACLFGCQSGGQTDDPLADRRLAHPKVAPGPEVDADKAYLAIDEIPPRVSLSPPNTRAAAEASPPTLRRMASAKELILQQRYTEAVSQLEKALRYDPLYGPLYRTLGICCRRSGALGRASSFLDKALMLNPADLVAHYHRAMVAAEGGEEQAALRHLRLAWICPVGEEDQICRALVALESAQRLEQAGYLVAAAELYAHFETVRAAWQQSELADPQEIDFVSTGPEVPALQIGRINERLGRLDQAARAYDRALRYAPANVVVQTGKARLLMRLGRGDQARELTRELLAAAAGDNEWNEIRALYTETGHGDELIEDLRIVAARPAPSIYVLEALFQAARHHSDPAEAETMVRKLIQVQGEESAAYARALEFFASRRQGRRAINLLADVLGDHPHRLGLLEQAVDQLSRNEPYARAVLESAAETLDDSPPDSAQEAATRYLVARLAATCGAEEQARAWLEDLIRHQPEVTAAYPLLGDLYVRQGRWQEAVDLIKRGLRPEEKLAQNAEAQLVLARAYQGLDEYEQAEDHFETVVSLRRDDAETACELGRLLERRGQLLRARRQYQAALAVKASHEEAHESLVRNFLVEHEAGLAREQLRAMKQALGQGAALARCQALWEYYDLVRSSRRARREITQDYADRLEQLADRDAQDVRTRLDLATALCDPLRQYDRAAQLLDEALAVEPHNKPGLELRVLVHRRALEFEQAAELLGKMLERHPNREAWMWQQARIYLTLQDYTPAVALFRKMLDRAKADADPGPLRRALLEAYVLADRFSEAAQAVRSWEDQYVAEAQDSPAALFTWRETLINQLLDADANNLALELAEDWYEEMPGDPAARLALFAALLAPADARQPGPDQEAVARRLQRAKLLLMQWLEDDPDSGDLNHWMISLLSLADQHQAAVELARNWRAGADHSSRSGNVLAAALMSAEEFDEAIRLYKQRARTSNRPDDFQRVAQAMIQARRHADAERYLLKLQERLRGGPGLRSEFGYLLYSCYLDWGKADLAERQLMQIVEDLETLSYEPGSGVAFRYFGACNDLAYLWAEQGKNLTRAERMIREAVSYSPGNSAYLDSLGWVRYKRGDLDGALKWLTRAARARRYRDAVILEHLGDTYWRLGRRDDAVESWSRALTLLQAQAEREELRPDEARSHQGIKQRLEQIERGEEPKVSEIVAPAATPEKQ